jgi:hypothetical protein
VGRLNDWFWRSPETVRFGLGENLYGHPAIASFRATRNPGTLYRRDTKTVITTFGRDFAAISVAFEQGDPPRAGRMSQSWVRTGDGWRIVAAHVSFLPSADQTKRTMARRTLAFLRSISVVLAKGSREKI